MEAKINNLTNKTVIAHSIGTYGAILAPLFVIREQRIVIFEQRGV